MITRRDVGERRGVEGAVDQSFLQEALEKNARATYPPVFFRGGGGGYS